MIAEWFVVEFRKASGEWAPVKASGGPTRAAADQTIETLMAFRLKEHRAEYRVARFVRDLKS